MKPAPLLCCCLILSLPLSAWPQSQPAQPTAAQGQEKKLVEEDQSTKVRNEVQKRGTGEKATVKVTLRDKTEVKGYISQIDEDSFQVTDPKSGRVTTMSYRQVGKVRKPGLSTGAKIAIGAGLVVGVVVAVALGSLAASGE